MNPYKIREFQTEDLSFILNSWLKSTREDFENTRTSVFFESYADHVRNVLARSKVSVACDEKDQNFIIGYIVHKNIEDVPVVHYAYTKGHFRKLGVFKSLLKSVQPKFDEDPILITYKNERRKPLFEKYQMIFKPELRGI